MDLKNIQIKKLEDKFTEQYGLPDPVCINKWGWSTIHMSVGETMSCHRVGGDPITPENYKDFHNTPSKIKDRELMLQGKWPETNGPGPKQPHHGCEVCREIEDAGGVSERHTMNSNSNLNSMVPKETRVDPKAVITSPTTLEIFFNNQCNLACIYCAPKFSSLIAAENWRHGTRTREVEQVLNYRKDYNQLLEAHFKWMKENAASLYRYKILGGEPFYQPELEQNIDFFMENKCPNLMISIFSNLNIDKDVFRTKLDKIKYLINNNHIKTLSLFCSFDCWGAEQEYIRHGINLKKWEENFLILLKEYPEIQLFVHSTLTVLTFQTFPDLCEKIRYWNLTRPVKHTLATVDSRPFLHPGILEEKFYEESIKKSIAAYQNIIKQTQNIHYERKWDNEEKIPLMRHYHSIIAQLKGYEKTFDAHKHDLELIKELKTFLDTNDSRRKTNWRSLWPWLDNYEV